MKKFIFITIITSTLLSSSQTYAMQSIQLLQQAILNICADLGTAAWIFSASRSIQSGINKVTVTLNENTTLANERCIEAPTQVTNFITSELQQIIPKKNVAIKIHPAYSVHCPVGTLTNNILIAQYVADEITEALKSNDQIILNKWRAVIQHEATHIKKNDIFWRSIADFTMPIITHALFELIWHLIKKDLSLTRSEELPMKIITTFWKSLTMCYVRMAIYRYQEKRADNGIASDISLLNGMKSFINDLEQINLKALSHLSPFSYKYTRWLDNFFEEHPLNSNRIKKIDKRIALLQKNQGLHSMPTMRLSESS